MKKWEITAACFPSHLKLPWKIEVHNSWQPPLKKDMVGSTPEPEAASFHAYDARQQRFEAIVTHSPSLRHQARTIWQAAVDAACPRELIHGAFTDPALGLREVLAAAPRILVVGAGKAGVAMAAAVEEVLANVLDRIEGLVNVPGDDAAQAAIVLQRIRRHIGRPTGTNQPTDEGVAGAEQILQLLASAGPQDVALCLLSGGGSALLPAPAPGVSLTDKQQVTRLMHQCGATINEMNAVRKHLSRIKGGRLAQAFTGRALHSLIISDVIGDPLDVIASGPTAPDPATFGDALGVLQRYQLLTKVPASVRSYVEAGTRGEVPETPKSLPANIGNHILGNNVRSLTAAQQKAEQLGHRVLNLGSYLEGETREFGIVLAGLIRSIRHDGRPVSAPVCVLSGGETTVTLVQGHGLGGRNQELVLTLVARLPAADWENVVVLSGGTDGEDGPTDAAGAVADASTLKRARTLGLDPAAFLARNDAYPFFAQTGDLLKTGLTGTNVMDVRVIMIGS
jgi:hydroxypyruvate reductase/glycerate 2-kinase